LGALQNTRDILSLYFGCPFKEREKVATGIDESIDKKTQSRNSYLSHNTECDIGPRGIA
jgi:hypothetical protein